MRGYMSILPSLERFCRGHVLMFSTCPMVESCCSVHCCGVKYFLSMDLDTWVLCCCRLQAMYSSPHMWKKGADIHEIKRKNTKEKVDNVWLVFSAALQANRLRGIVFGLEISHIPMFHTYYTPCVVGGRCIFYFVKEGRRKRSLIRLVFFFFKAGYQIKPFVPVSLTSLTFNVSCQQQSEVQKKKNVRHHPVFFKGNNSKLCKLVNLNFCIRSHCPVFVTFFLLFFFFYSRWPRRRRMTLRDTTTPLTKKRLTLGSSNR